MCRTEKAKKPLAVRSVVRRLQILLVISAPDNLAYDGVAVGLRVVRHATYYLHVIHRALFPRRRKLLNRPRILTISLSLEVQYRSYCIQFDDRNLRELGAGYFINTYSLILGNARTKYATETRFMILTLVK